MIAPSYARAAHTRPLSPRRAAPLRARGARVNAFVRMHSRSCGRPPCPACVFFFPLLLHACPPSLSPLAPLSPVVAFLSSLYVIASRRHLSVRTRAAWSGAARREVGSGSTEHVIRVRLNSRGSVDTRFSPRDRAFRLLFSLLLFFFSLRSFSLRNMEITRRSRFSAWLNESRALAKV